MISPKEDFKGFRLSHNMKSALIECAVVLVPTILTELATNNMISAGIAAVVSEMIYKAYKFWKKEKEIL